MSQFIEYGSVERKEKYVGEFFLFLTYLVQVYTRVDRGRYSCIVWID